MSNYVLPVSNLPKYLLDRPQHNNSVRSLSKVNQ